MGGVQRGEDVGADDVVVGHREVVAEVEDALVLEQDVFARSEPERKAEVYGVTTWS